LINTSNETKTQDNNIVIQEINETTKNDALFINLINKVFFQKWYVEIILKSSSEFQLTIIALLDSGIDMNFIKKEIIPTKYYEKTIEKLHQANGTRLNIKYKISNAHICNDRVCFKTFILVKNITSKIILRNSFLALLDPFIKAENGISTEILRKKISFKFVLLPMTKDINMLKDI
jgi:hypothetical protein